MEEINILSNGLFDGSFIPHCIMSRSNKEISDGAKILYARLFRYRGKNEYAFPKRIKLAEDLGKSERQIDRILTELEELKLIRSEQRGKKRSNIYYFLQHPWITDQFKTISDSSHMSTHEESDSTHVSTSDSTHVSTPYEVSHYEVNHSLNICAVEEVFNYWRLKIDHPKAKLDPKRKSAIKKALKNYSVSDLKDSIDGCLASEYHIQGGFDDIELICRNSTKTDHFIKIFKNPILGKIKTASSKHDGFMNAMRNALAEEE